MQRWAFHSQIYFLSNKFKLHRAFDRTQGVVALDRTIFEDAEIFATALHDMGGMDDRDFATYWDFYQTILETIRPPDLLIYVKCSMRTLRRRIKQRGRAMEQDIPLAYLKRLPGEFFQRAPYFYMNKKIDNNTTDKGKQGGN